MLGRVFTEDEDNKGVRVVVISHGLWQRRFGGSPDIIGRKITLNDEPYEVIGVMPRELLLHALARYRHLDAGVVPAVDAHGTSRGTMRRSSRGSSPASRWSRRGSRWRH